MALYGKELADRMISKWRKRMSIPDPRPPKKPTRTQDRCPYDDWSDPNGRAWNWCVTNDEHQLKKLMGEERYKTFADELEFTNVRSLSLALCERIALEITLEDGVEPLPFGLRGTAILMLEDLNARRLRVVLIPSRVPEVAQMGGKIRAVESENPTWYKRLCRTYEAQRTRPRRRKKHDTLIKRAQVRSTLARMAQGNGRGEYAQRLIPFLWRFIFED